MVRPRVSLCQALCAGMPSSSWIMRLAGLGVNFPSSACDRNALSSPLASIPASGGHMEAS
ncbi:hypothetical protein PR003_g8858 [Phytophthora rubi]|uniref:Uncharacterized protein n=1 Tax=Phytophthora rubi TaxID=129364 RepID=A0A6A4FFX5_9STRA|nr:hypothetical protein PR003_g8858 [Phytophthora rubi]